MKISIRNYRRVATADIEIERGVALVAGVNKAGKSSLIEAIRAGVAMDPLVGLDTTDGKKATKGRAGELVRSGSDGASVTVAGPGGVSQVLWPTCESKVSGNGGPKANAYALGLGESSLVSLSKAHRFAVLRDVLGAAPTYEDLQAWLAADSPVPVPEPMLRAIWGAIVEKGWDRVGESAKEKGIGFKTRFENATGERWGVAKGAGWRPAGWDLLWETVAVEDATRAAAEARAKVEALRGQKLVDTEALEARIATEGEKTTALALAREKLADIEAMVEKNAAECAAHVVLGEENRVKCPCCGEMLQMVREAGHGGGETVWKLQKPTGNVSEKAIKESRLKKASLDGEAARLRQEVAHASREVLQIEMSLTAIEEAKKELAGAAEVTANAGADLAAAEAALKGAEDLVKAILVVTEATQLHHLLVQNASIQRALSETGVRAKVMVDKIVAFNETLVSIAQIGKLGPVALSTDDLSLMVAGRPYWALSGSEALRARVMLQIGIAKHTGADVIAVDIRDATDRNHVLGIIKMLLDSGIPAVVASHANTPAEAPDLECEAAVKAGYIGRTYWVADGVVKPMAEVVGA